MCTSAVDNEVESLPTQDIPLEDLLIPGTQVMNAVANLHPSRVDEFGQALFPAPTDNPADPLNWSRFWKGSAIISLALYTCFAAVAAISAAPLFGIFAEQWDLTETQVTMINGATVIVMGVGNFVVIPFSNVFGRRAVVNVFGLLFIACTIWEATAQSYNSFIAARCVIGLAASSSESLVVQVVADLFFLHERGAWVGFSMLAAFSGTFIGPVIAGAMGERYGWRSFFWLSLGLYAFTMIFALPFFPETKYYRPPQKQDMAVSSGHAEKDGAVVESQVEAGGHGDNNEVVTVLVRHGRPSRGQFLPVMRPDQRWKAWLLRDFCTPFRIIYYPIILWSSFCLVVTADLVFFYNLTESYILGSPLYRLNAAEVGYTNFAFLAGAIMGMATAGPFSDWAIKRATKRNAGVREAEMRLPALLPFTAVLIVSFAVAAAALQHDWPWPWLVIFGYGGSGLALTSIPTIGLAYGVDCYKPVAGELMVVATLFKNFIGFSMVYWVPSLSKRKNSLMPALMVWFGVAMLPLVLAVPLWVWGKRLRSLTQTSPVHHLEEPE